jgi:phosphodiesterase/alkaline phosphatase D-like protein
MIIRSSHMPVLILLALGVAGCSQRQQATREIRVTNGPTIHSISDTTARITWSTNVSSPTLLRYGVRPDNLDQVTREPWDGLTHRVQLTNLKPETTYYYRVVAPVLQKTEPMSAPASFTTLKPNALKGG